MMRGVRLWWMIIFLLLAIIIVLAWLLFSTPAPSAPAPVATSTPAQTTAPTPPEPLSARVRITSPKENAPVSHDFDVEGRAPGSWFFEAQFPIQVRDGEDNVLGRATGSAQGDWQTSNLVAFKATMHIDGSYHGPATLILMKDNPSGLPENDDSVEIPIVIE